MTEFKHLHGFCVGDVIRMQSAGFRRNATKFVILSFRNVEYSNQVRLITEDGKIGWYNFFTDDWEKQ